jgi:hypothetical protein
MTIYIIALHDHLLIPLPSAFNTIAAPTLTVCGVDYRSVGAHRVFLFGMLAEY